MKSFRLDPPAWKTTSSFSPRWTSVTFPIPLPPTLASSFDATSLKCLTTTSSSFPLLLPQSVFPMPTAFYINPLFDFFIPENQNKPKIVQTSRSSSPEHHFPIYIKHTDIHITFRQLVASTFHVFFISVWNEGYKKNVYLKIKQNVYLSEAMSLVIWCFTPDPFLIESCLVSP